MFASSSKIDDSTVTTCIPKSILKKSTLEIFDSSTDPMDEIIFGSSDYDETMTNNKKMGPYALTRSMLADDASSNSSSDERQQRSKLRLKYSSNKNQIHQQRIQCRSSKQNAIIARSVQFSPDRWPTTFRPSDDDRSSLDLSTEISKSSSISSLQFLFDVARRVGQERRTKIESLRCFIEQKVGIATLLTLYRLIQSSHVSIDFRVQPFSSYKTLVPHICCLILLETEESKN